MGSLTCERRTDHFQKIRDSIRGDAWPSLTVTTLMSSLSKLPSIRKNIQSMLKLGRAQGAAISAALYRDLPVAEYAPRMIKMSITGQGQASKEQVATMLRTILSFHGEKS
ncbi:MAG: crossover junction endodeoxyribonuclease RuvC [Marinilabiliales bacterium]|nr:crossover junction endodeoxyribonuclease RuvC [Marinilabiliales bacterium]